MLILLGSTAEEVWLNEILVRHVASATVNFRLSEFFLGVIVVPIIGNVTENMVAASVAIKDRKDRAVEITVGSSLQIALLVVLVLVFVSLAMGNPLTLVFNEFELSSLVGGVLIATLVAADGKASWLEGSVLLSLYFLLALAYFLLH